MSSSFEINAPGYKAKNFIRFTEFVFEAFVYTNLFFWILSYSEFNKQELVVFIAVGVFFIIFLSKINLSKSINQEFLKLVLTISFILIFDKIDHANTWKFIQLPIMDRIPMPTLFLSLTTLIYVSKVILLDKCILTVSDFAKNFGIACLFLLIITILFYPVLYSRYELSIQSDLQLLNKIIKYCIIILLVQENVKSDSLLRRLVIGIALSVSIICILNIVL